ncbi:MAG TPA: FprA family A-type flavoprotein [Bacillota bacterium]|nr:FprA family A-type flavoprotein [Bacillota bacterium]
MQIITNRVTLVGAPDPKLPYFDVLMPTPYGTTYNSYLVRGDVKTALIDPVQSDKIECLLRNLKAMKVEKLDYIFCLHTEQDHSGAIIMLCDLFPEAQLVGSAKVAELMEFHFHIPRGKFQIVAEGDVISLGGISLVCMPVPFAHWPDNTMFWVPEERVLFSSDLFGSHYAPAVASCPDKAVQLLEARAYFSEIMMPTSTHVARYTAKVRELNPAFICAAHGPVWFEPDAILSEYELMVSNKVRRDVVLAYVTMHESTGRMVQVLADELCAEGIRVSLFNLGDPKRDLRVTLGSVVTETVNAAAFLLASPTVLGGPHPSAAAMALMINAFNPSLRFMGILGSFGWGSQMVKQLEGLTARVKAERLEPLLLRGLPTEEGEEQIRQYARELAGRLKAIPEEEIV